MNVQEALEHVTELVEGANSATEEINQVHVELSTIESTIAEALGADNEQVGILGRAVDQAEKTAETLSAGIKALEELRDILASIV